MDVRMPGLDGVEATRRIVTADPNAHVLVLTTVEDDEVVLDALRAGASGFLLKSVPRERLWAGIRSVAAGDLPLAPSVTRRPARPGSTTGCRARTSCTSPTGRLTS